MDLGSKLTLSQAAQAFAVGSPLVDIIKLKVSQDLMKTAAFPYRIATLANTYAVDE